MAARDRSARRRRFRGGRGRSRGALSRIGAAWVAGLVALALAAPPPSAAVSLRPVAASGDADPLGGAWGSVQETGFTATGEIAFEATTNGIFARVGAALVTVAAPGTATPAGGTFANFGFPAANAAGDVVFWADVNGGSAPSGLFLWSGGTLSSLVLLGDPAPGVGGTFPASIGSPP